MSCFRAIGIMSGGFLLCTLSPAWAGYSGFMETTLQMDNFLFNNNRSYLEQWGEVIYTDRIKGQQAVLQFGLRGGDEGEIDHALHQLYFRTQIERYGSEVTIGRFDHADGGGFYTLDGISLQSAERPVRWNLFAGSSKRIDDYDGLSGGFLLGAEGRYQAETGSGYSGLKTVNTRLGLQHQWHDENALRMTWGMGGSGGGDPKAIGLKRFNVSGSFRLDQQEMDALSGSADIDLQTYGRMHLLYDFYQPGKTPASFRDRFYHDYARGRQSVAKGSWHRPLTRRLTGLLEVSRRWREIGSSGSGMAAELNYRDVDGWRLESRLDYLTLNGDESISLYGRVRKALTAFVELELEAVLQRKETQLSGSNQAIGSAFRLKRRLRKDLFIDLFGEYIDQSDRDNEYRLGLSLRYDFFKMPQAGVL